MQNKGKLKRKELDVEDTDNNTLINPSEEGDDEPKDQFNLFLDSFKYVDMRFTNHLIQYKLNSESISDCEFVEYNLDIREDFFFIKRYLILQCRLQN